MPAAAADAPVGSHHGCQMKKYVLTKVINQITARRARPIYNDLQGSIFVIPQPANKKLENCGWPQSLSQPHLTSASRFANARPPEIRVTFVPLGRKLQSSS